MGEMWGRMVASCRNTCMPQLAHHKGPTRTNAVAISENESAPAQLASGRFRLVTACSGNVTGGLLTKRRLRGLRSRGHHDQHERHLGPIRVGPRPEPLQQRGDKQWLT